MAVAKTTTKRNCKYTHTNIEKGKTRLVKKEKSENGKSNENLRVSNPQPLYPWDCSECRKRKRNWSWKSCE